MLINFNFNLKYVLTIQVGLIIMTLVLELVSLNRLLNDYFEFFFSFSFLWKRDYFELQYLFSAST